MLASKFSRDREELSRVAVLLGELAVIVEPTAHLNVFRDEPDNRILECASAMGEYDGIRLITLANYLKKPERRR